MPLSVSSAYTFDSAWLSDVKEHLRITGNDDDLYLETIVRAAIAEAEKEQDRQLIRQTWRLTMDSFCDTRYMRYEDYAGWVMRVPRPPLIDVTSIVYVNTSGTSTTLAASDYTVDTYTTPGRIAPAYGESWPATRSQPNAVTVTYRAGYGTTMASVPASTRAGLLITIGNLYEHRESILVGGSFNLLPTAKSLFACECWGSEL